MFLLQLPSTHNELLFESHLKLLAVDFCRSSLFCSCISLSLKFTSRNTNGVSVAILRTSSILLSSYLVRNCAGCLKITQFSRVALTEITQSTNGTRRKEFAWRSSISSRTGSVKPVEKIGHANSRGLKNQTSEVSNSQDYICETYRHAMDVLTFCWTCVRAKSPTYTARTKAKT